MNLRFNLDAKGMITEIGYSSNYKYAAPAWMTMNSLNIKCINSNAVQDQKSWQDLPIPNAVVVDLQRIFCQSFQAELLTALRDEELTDEQRIELLIVIMDAMNTLSWGDVEVSRYAFANTQLTALWTKARRDWVLAKLDGYLNR